MQFFFLSEAQMNINVIVLSQSHHFLKLQALIFNSYV